MVHSFAAFATTDSTTILLISLPLFTDPSRTTMVSQVYKGGTGRILIYSSQLLLHHASHSPLHLLMLLATCHDKLLPLESNTCLRGSLSAMAGVTAGTKS